MFYNEKKAHKKKTENISVTEIQSFFQLFFTVDHNCLWHGGGLTVGDWIFKDSKRSCRWSGGRYVTVERVVVGVRHRQRVDQPVHRLLFTHRNGRRESSELWGLLKGEWRL